MAGSSRLKQPPEIKVIRVPCSGRVDPLFIIKALEEGADGVIVSGCHPGDCHYGKGNYYAERRFRYLKQILPFFGIDSERFHYTWVSATEGAKWQETAVRFTEKILGLGHYE